MIGRDDGEDEQLFMEALSAAARPLTHRDARDLIVLWYDIERNIVGGTLHIVLDDGNWEREHVEFCRTWAIEKGDKPGVAFAEALLTLTDDQLREWLCIDGDRGLDPE